MSDDLAQRVEKLEAMLGQFGGMGPVVDPAPFPWPQPIPFPFPRPLPWPRPWPGPWPGPEVDPVPIDLSRLSRVQLERVRHHIATERTRLDLLEEMVNKFEHEAK